MELPKRKILRLPEYDYSTPGAYFITICTQNRICFFQSEPIQTMNQKWWDELPQKFPNVETDEFVVMPNHIHGILIIAGPYDVRADLRVGPRVRLDGDANGDGHVGPSLPTIVQWYKTMTTNEYIRGVKQLGWPPYPSKLWQRSYYEHIIRDDREYNAIRHYIRENPVNWHRDRNRPDETYNEPGL